MRILSLSLLLLTGVVAFGPAAEAQSNRNYGTAYSRFGVGERLSFASSQAAMMGGASVAVRSPIYNGLDNPALWSDLALTQFSISAAVEGLKSEDAAGDRARLTSGTLEGLQFGVPLLAGRLGMTLALRPFSRVNYLAIRDGSLDDPDFDVDSLAYRINFEGDGGLQQARLGLGYRISDNLAVGASVDVLFGAIDYIQRTTFDSATIPEARSTRETTLSGFSGTLGAVASKVGVFGEEDAASFGVSLSLPTRLSGDRTDTIGFSLDQDTLATADDRLMVGGDVTVPLQIVAGLAYAPDARWLLAADVRYEPWSGFESDFAFGGFDPGTGTDQLRDRLRVGGGFEFLPAGAERGRAYFARTAYRLGGYYDRAYYDAGLGTPDAITTLALTGGLSLPAVLPTARFDLGFEIGTRGTTERGLVRDLFIKGSATINFGERWFRQRRLG
ncbi:MAG: hypothetical protein AAGI91_16470 [Bacteroidota bacterium]